jgi:hypothetical protein
MRGSLSGAIFFFWVNRGLEQFLSAFTAAIF